MGTLEECGHSVKWLRFYRMWRGQKHYVCSICHPNHWN